MMERINKLRRAALDISLEQGRQARADELAERLNLSEQQVHEMHRIAKDTVSLQTPLKEREDGYLGDTIEDNQTRSPMDAAIDNGLQRHVRGLLEVLSPREAEVLALRHGIGTEREHTLSEIGEVFGVSRERVRQIQAQALKKVQQEGLAEHLRAFVND
jgi:RNA polymerase primary sigma factor